MRSILHIPAPTTLRKRSIAVALSAALALGWACGDSPSQSRDWDGLSVAIDSLIGDYESLGIFSGVVLVASKGSPFYLKAFGPADRGSGTPNNTSTLFDIGSMNKTFTDIVVRQLAEEGKLDLQDKMSSYLPGFSDPRASEITIQHLLEHRSGFTDYHSQDYFNLPLEERRLAAIVERAKSSRLEFDPGTSEAYSNLGYVILGGVIEAATGRSYFEEVRDRIKTPLQLEDTYLTDFSGLSHRVAKGYFYAPLGQLEENVSLQDLHRGDGYVGVPRRYPDLLSLLLLRYTSALAKGEAAGSAFSIFKGIT